MTVKKSAPYLLGPEVTFIDGPTLGTFVLGVDALDGVSILSANEVFENVLVSSLTRVDNTILGVSEDKLLQGFVSHTDTASVLSSEANTLSTEFTIFDTSLTEANVSLLTLGAAASLDNVGIFSLGTLDLVGNTGLTDAVVVSEAEFLVSSGVLSASDSDVLSSIDTFDIHVAVSAQDEGIVVGAESASIERFTEVILPEIGTIHAANDYITEGQFIFEVIHDMSAAESFAVSSVSDVTDLLSIQVQDVAAYHTLVAFSDAHEISETHEISHAFGLFLDELTLLLSNDFWTELSNDERLFVDSGLIEAFGDAFLTSTLISDVHELLEATEAFGIFVEQPLVDTETLDALSETFIPVFLWYETFTDAGQLGCFEFSFIVTETVIGVEPVEGLDPMTLIKRESLPYLILAPKQRLRRWNQQEPFLRLLPRIEAQSRPNVPFLRKQERANVR